MSDYDVYVHEDHIIEVHRGEHGTVARIFGEDWCTQPMVQFHPPAMAPVSPPLSLKLTADPNREVRTGLAFKLTFVALLLLCVWAVLR